MPDREEKTTLIERFTVRIFASKYLPKLIPDAVSAVEESFYVFVTYYLK